MDLVEESTCHDTGRDDERELALPLTFSTLSKFDHDVCITTLQPQRNPSSLSLKQAKTWDGESERCDVCEVEILG